MERKVCAVAIVGRCVKVSVGCPSFGGQRTVCGARAGSNRGTPACCARLAQRQGTQALASAQRVVRQARCLTIQSSRRLTARLNSNVKRLPSVMNQEHSVNRCEAGCGGSQGLRVGHRRVVHQCPRGLSVLRRPAHGLWCASRFAAGHASVFAAACASARNTGLALGAAVASSTNPPNR